ncbi:uncharacterized protein VDAG_01626 [Verticillium dahliae VdLs.17]|uniref:Uncharacterized protein n=1 Tax=Verticillium dahliae (strain VdLs.17 / ATCC MYA-4575 / FGSC 10137) TaxID=498257 RepID=G2WSN0_VERDV|nr:uncharacterized protein VDAG_01626 [Verticillium dahliae VdLs.17]EGY17944.1 hypothetical protein VDAG_01626 [Verticillium dahliae VdLs.17]
MIRPSWKRQRKEIRKTREQTGLPLVKQNCPPFCCTLGRHGGRHGLAPCIVCASPLQRVFVAKPPMCRKRRKAEAKTGMRSSHRHQCRDKIMDALRLPTRCILDCLW